MVGYGFTILSETPCADPHAGCCGGWGLETPGYPIREKFIIYADWLNTQKNATPPDLTSPLLDVCSAILLWSEIYDGAQTIVGY